MRTLMCGIQVCVHVILEDIKSSIAFLSLCFLQPFHH